MHKILLSLLVLLFSEAFAAKALVPVQMDCQREIYIQGASVLQSVKKTEMTLFQTVESLEYGKANFYFHFRNNSCHPVDLIFSNLRVTDQYGRPIKVVHKRKLIENKRREANTARFFSALATISDSYNAQRAGDIDCYSYTNNHSNTYTPRGVISSSGCSSTHSVIHSEALRQNAVRQANRDAFIRNVAIDSSLAHAEDKLTYCYFDSTTIFPNERFESGFQIEVPKHIEHDLQYLYFTFDLGSESHTFSFYCHPESRRWYCPGR